MSHESKMIEIQSDTTEILHHVTGMQTPEQSLGERIIKSEQMQDFLSGRADIARIPLTPMEYKTAILGGGHAANDPLTMTYHPAIAPLARRRLTVLDLLLQTPTTEAAAEHPVQESSGSTNNAGPQVGGSPEAYEGQSFGESAAAFSLTHRPIRTIGHFIPVSRNVLTDSPVLDLFIRQTLLHYLMLKVEDQLLNGTNANGQLEGLLPSAAAYSVQSPSLTNELDIVADAMRQVLEADWNVDAIIMHPADWYSIVVRKTGSSMDSYVLGAPLEQTTPRLFGMPVILSNSISSGTTLIADFQHAAAVFTREEASIEISQHDSDNFQRGMVTVKATTRLAQVITNSTALIKATI